MPDAARHRACAGRKAAGSGDGLAAFRTQDLQDGTAALRTPSPLLASSPPHLHTSSTPQLISPPFTPPSLLSPSWAKPATVAASPSEALDAHPSSRSCRNQGTQGPKVPRSVNSFPDAA
eukprot:3996102-Pyramimonas_sp.AAC.2